MLSIVSSNLLWTEGLYIVIVLCMVAIIGFAWYKPLLWLSCGLFAFSFYFFRNPERICPQAVHDEQVLICPADGMVVDIQYNNEPGAEFTKKVSIFLSPFDVHVNWIPMAGTIDDVQYKPGSFSLAFLPKSSELNERNDIIIKNKDGNKIVVRQIAGTIARRICCWVQPHQQVASGQKYGMIRFGSRVDILLPDSVELFVGIGQRVYGGQTPLGRWIPHA